MEVALQALREVNTDVNNDGTECRDDRVWCNQLACFGSCKENEYGGECEPCPEYLVGNGTVCIDPRPTCAEVDCFQSCFDDDQLGAVCSPCPTGFEGDGLICTDVRLHCEGIECGKKEICKETETGGVCEQCPVGTVSNGLNCTEPVDIDYTTCSSQDRILISFTLFLSYEFYPHKSHVTKGLNVTRLDLVFAAVPVLMDTMEMVSTVKR